MVGRLHFILELFYYYFILLAIKHRRIITTQEERARDGSDQHDSDLFHLCNVVTRKNYKHTNIINILSL